MIELFEYDLFWYDEQDELGIFCSQVFNTPSWLQVRIHSYDGLEKISVREGSDPDNLIEVEGFPPMFMKYVQFVYNRKEKEEFNASLLVKKWT